MKRSCVMAVVLVAAATVGAAQTTLSPLFTRKGAIQAAWIDPGNPTATTPVMLHVAMVDALVLDRAEVRQSMSMITVKLYWKEPPGDGGPPALYLGSLGLLPKGRYFLSVQSYCQDRFADTESLSFNVTPGSPSDNKQIEEVWVQPAEPTTDETVMLHISGLWPTPGYTLVGTSLKIFGTSVTFDMHWFEPDDDEVIQVITPYEKVVNLHRLTEGLHTVRINCYLERRRVDFAEISFEVQAGSAPPDEFPWPWFDWPWW